jgi:hypothetical protein
VVAVPSLTSLTTNAGGTTAINGGLVVTAGAQTYNDAVTLGADATLNAGTATLTAASSLTAGANALALIADEINLTGGANSVSGSGPIALQPATASLAISTGTAAGGGGALDLSTADIGALADGFSSITIGQAAGTHAIAVGNTTFVDPVVIQASGAAGLITVSGALNAAGNSITLNAGRVASVGGGITSTDRVLITSTNNGIGAVGSELQTATPMLLARNTGATGDIAISNAAALTTLFTEFRNDAANAELRLSTVNGSIDTGSANVQGAGGRVAFIANDAGAGGNITVGGGGIISGGGAVNLHAADVITINGSIATSGGNLRMIAGTGPGIVNQAPGFPFTFPNPPMATEAVDDVGLIVLNAPVITGSGNTVLVTSANGTAGLAGGITQGPDGPILTNKLTAVTLRSAGGLNNGGAEIDLNNADPVRNSAAGVVSLFACPTAGCPAGTAPFDTASFINKLPGPPPANLYADGPIFYTDASGTNITGIGTVNDFVFFNPGPSTTTIDGTTLFGRRLTVEAAGDIDIRLAVPITDGNIGETLRFVSSGSINYLPTTVGNTAAGTFGQPGTAYNHNLQFVAADNINFSNAIYMGGTGSLTVNANQNVTFVSPIPPAPPLLPSGVHALATGTGSVTMQGNHEIRVGGDLTVNGVDLLIKGGQLSPVSPNQNAIGQQLIVAGTLNLNMTGNVSVLGGTATASSGGAALVQGAAVNVGTSNARVQSLLLTGGSSPGGGAGTTTSHQSDARVTATGDLNVYLSGDLRLTGGTTSIATGAAGAVTASAMASLQGGNVVLDALGNVVMRGGSAAAQAGGNTATSSVELLSGSAFNPIIQGDLTIQGGTATATPGSGQTANAQSNATLEASGNLTLNVAGGLNLVGGQATANLSQGGNAATASANAALNSDGTKKINVGSDFIVRGGSATTAETGAVDATALAAVNAGTTGFADSLGITAFGNMTLTGGNEVNLGIASAAILAGGEIKVTVHGPQGLQLIGGSGSNLFQAVGSTTLVELPGNAYPITITGGYHRIAGFDAGDAFFISGAPPLLFTDPAFLRAMDCIAIAGGFCVLPATGARAGDPSKLTAGRVCK